MPYTYLIGWEEHDLYYYGARYSAKSCPSDLWTSYFTSSHDVKLARQKLGEPDVIEIRKVFNGTTHSVEAEKCVKWESRAIKRMLETSNKNWLNKSYRGCHLSSAKFWNKDGKTVRSFFDLSPDGWKRGLHSIETKSKMSKARTGFVMSDSTKRKLSEINTGKKLSEETKTKMSMTRKGVKKTEEHLEKIRAGLKGKKFECPHCKKTGGTGLFRWHFDRCKQKM